MEPTFAKWLQRSAADALRMNVGCAKDKLSKEHCRHYPRDTLFIVAMEPTMCRQGDLKFLGKCAKGTGGSFCSDFTLMKEQCGQFRFSSPKMHADAANNIHYILYIKDTMTSHSRHANREAASTHLTPCRHCSRKKQTYYYAPYC